MEIIVSLQLPVKRMSEARFVPGSHKVPTRPTFKLKDYILEQVMTELTAMNARHHNDPGPGIMADMRRTAQTAIEVMEGGHQGKLFYNTNGTGSGKSSLIACIGQVLSIESQIGGADVGLMVCHARHDQIEDLILTGQFADSQFTVVTAADAKTVNPIPEMRGLDGAVIRKAYPAGTRLVTMGVQLTPEEKKLAKDNNRDEQEMRANKSQLLFVTQAQLFHHLKGANPVDGFSRCQRFWYKGKPRYIHWDEKYSSRQASHPSRSTLMDAMSLRKIPLSLRQWVRQVDMILDYAEPGQVYELPPITEPVDYYTLCGPNDDGTEKSAWKLEALKQVCLMTYAKEVKAVQSNGEDMVLLSYIVTLPADFANGLIVYDAGAHRKESVRQMKEKPIFLSEFEKDYTGTSIKAMFAKDGLDWFWRKAEGYKVRIPEACQIIKAAWTIDQNRLPMITCHKEPFFRKGEIRKTLVEALGSEELADKVKVITHGNNTGTSKARDCDLVLHLTSWHKPNYDSQGKVHTSQDLHINDALPEGSVEDYALTEVVSETEQSWGRSCIRELRNGVAKPCEIYAWCSDERIIESVADNMKNVSKEWIVTRPKRKLKRVPSRDRILSFLDRWVEERNGLTCHYSQVYTDQAVGLDRSNFAKEMVKPEMLDALTDRGWRIRKTKSNSNMLERDRY